MAEKKLRIREVIVVEGRYDRNTLSQVVDALIFETNGFAVFNDREKLDALRMLAEERGLILLTDSDSAGFVIRNRLKSLIPPEKIKSERCNDIGDYAKSLMTSFIEKNEEEENNVHLRTV